MHQIPERTNRAWKEDLLAHHRPATAVGALAAWFACPGFRIIRAWRTAKWLTGKGTISRAIGRLIHIWFIEGSGCFISLRANIGPRLYLPHPTAVVIGEGVEVGAGVTIYQCTTLGRRHERASEYPRVRNDVTIYAGAVLVGNVEVGQGAVVGANAVVTRDVPEAHIAMGIPARSTPKRSSE